MQQALMSLLFLGPLYEGEQMTIPRDYVHIVQREAEDIATFLNTLSVDDWQRPSACDLWAIQDVTAHLIWAANFYTDTVSRGIQGDHSLPEDRPPGDAPDPASMPAYFDQQAMKIRDHLEGDLTPTLRSSFQALSSLMLGLSPEEWEMPCSFTAGIFVRNLISPRHLRQGVFHP
jgi:uncharacterized protein (TIGR03083 family)